MSCNRYYIFLTHCVCDVGGMQLYVSRKIDYLKSNGWIPLVFYYREGDISIPNLKDYKDNYLPVLRYCVGNVTETKRQNVLKLIKERLGPYNQLVIESCCLALGTWGEYIASEFRGKHILYVIDEVISYPTEEMKRFLDFKIKQNLLYCINPNVIQRVWQDRKNLSALKLTATGATSMNVVDEESAVINSLVVGDNTILSLGRLDKPYISHLFDVISEFAGDNANLRIDLIIIGDTPNDKEKDALLAKFNGVSNLCVHPLGYVWPIPKRLFSKVKVAVGSAGSIVLCNRQGVPSIAIDGKDYEAIGLYGINTNNSLFRGSNDPQFSIKEWLQQIIIEKQYSHYIPEVISTPDYSRHQEIIDTPFDYTYYPTHKSSKFVTYPVLRSAMIALDQNRYGHMLFKKLWGSAFFNNLVSKINKTDYKSKK